ncbi:hypothetical protein [Pseudorhizobium flavum]|uniref:hypothetical protein n=1 Tax=Pseudorhizobium flavum TaxID=1335061 RepID=UPI0037703F6E
MCHPLSACGQLVIRKHLEWLADCENGFGPATALLLYGKGLISGEQAPKWVSFGGAKECYKNAAQALLHRDDVFYAEGIAVDLVGPPVPVEHAWLVQDDGVVVDPTWRDSGSCAYYGIAFKSSVVREKIRREREWQGVLSDPVLMRSCRKTPEIFQEMMVQVA